MAGTLSGMRPEPGRPRAGASRRKPFPPPPFAPFRQRERCGDPSEACDAKDQRRSAAAPGGRGEEPAPAGACRRVQQDGGLGLPEARPGGGDQMNDRRTYLGGANND